MAPITRRTALAAIGGVLPCAFNRNDRLAAQPAIERTGRTLAAHLSAYTSTLTVADLSPDTIEAAKFRIIDALGCALGAFNEPPVAAVRRVVSSASGAATIIGTARRCTTDLAAFANGVAVRFLDYNDVYVGQETGHPSDLIGGVLAVAEAEERTGLDAILATALAYEINCHLLDTAQISAKGWDHPNFVLPAAALAAGVLMRLTPPQLEQAVNLSLSGHLAMYQTRSQEISNWKGMAAAEAVRAGVFAAELARADVTGPAPIFEGTSGFFRQVSGDVTVDVSSFARAGGRFKIEDCALKFYPAQTQTLTAIPAAVALAKQIGDLNRIAAIDVATTKMGVVYTANEPNKWAPASSETADHSMPYIVARAMVDGEITAHSYDLSRLPDERVRSLMARTTVREDPTLTALSPDKIPNSITVTLTDGRTLVERVDELPGFRSSPMRRSDLEDKFRRNVDAVLPAARRARCTELAWNLDKEQTLQRLLGSLSIEQ